MNEVKFMRKLFSKILKFLLNMHLKSRACWNEVLWVSATKWYDPWIRKKNDFRLFPFATSRHVAIACIHYRKSSSTSIHLATMTWVLSGWIEVSQSRLEFLSFLIVDVTRRNSQIHYAFSNDNEFFEWIHNEELCERAKFISIVVKSIVEKVKRWSRTVAICSDSIKCSNHHFMHFMEVEKKIAKMWKTSSSGSHCLERTRLWIWYYATCNHEDNAKSQVRMKIQPPTRVSKFNRLVDWVVFERNADSL